MEIVCNYKIPEQILDLVSEARRGETIFVVTPYLDLTENVIRAVRTAKDSKAEVEFYVRSDVRDRPEKDIRRLQDMEVKVHEIKNLHAKLYWSPRKVIISSMNLLKSSMNDSLEIAIILEDSGSIERTRTIIADLIKDEIKSGRTSVGKSAKDANERTPTRALPLSQQYVYCIRCGQPNTRKGYPLCDFHFQEWSQWANGAYPESYCHRCGSASSTCYDYPLCPSCYAQERTYR
jgi:phosphatidylserine/phosphatidylglycerophosphate/cardiolipin synthase-like enzyme